MKNGRRMAAAFVLVGAVVMTLQPASSYPIFGTKTVDTGRYTVGVSYCLSIAEKPCLSVKPIIIDDRQK